MIKNKSCHKAVLLKEAIDALKINPNGNYFDLTFGGGGHSMAILDLLDKGNLFSFDKDSNVDMSLIKDKRFYGIKADFIYLTNYILYYNIKNIDGIILDLGLSSMQIDDNNRGFSYKFDAVLDMRIDNKSKLTAFDVINRYDKKKLEFIISNYGDIFNAKKIVGKIIKYRKQKDIKTTFELINILDEFAVRTKNYNQFISKFFQSLRIEVNKEMEALKILMKQLTNILSQESRVVIISYHSLEDRIVKNFIKRGIVDEQDLDSFRDDSLCFVNKGVIIPDEEELSYNSRARSARMRIIKKI